MFEQHNVQDRLPKYWSGVWIIGIVSKMNQKRAEQDVRERYLFFNRFLNIKYFPKELH